MPLVKYAGNSSVSDLTDAIKLADDVDGVPRELVKGGPAVEVTGEELRSAAANGYELHIIEPGSEEDDSDKDAAGPVETGVTQPPDNPAGVGAQSGAQAVRSGDVAAVVNPASSSPTTSTPAQPGS